MKNAEKMRKVRNQFPQEMIQFPQEISNSNDEIVIPTTFESKIRAATFHKISFH
jgi:hypothetical protein